MKSFIMVIFLRARHILVAMWSVWKLVFLDLTFRLLLQGLIENLDRDLLYAMRVEGKMDVEFVSNYDQVKNAIMEKVIVLRDELTQEESPLIYHLDVAIMYPIIILTNRLQDLNYCYKTLRVNHNESSKSRQLVCYFGSKDMRAHLWIQRITN